MEPRIRALYTPARARQDEGGGQEPLSKELPDRMVEKELRPKQLIEGMLVTRDLSGSAGQVILTSGTVLDTHKIASVARQYSIDPPQGGIHVSWSPAEPGARSGSEAAEDLSLKLRSGQPVDGSWVNGTAELRPKQLLEGMRITRKLYSGTGLLLLAEGTLLDSAKIARIIRYYEIDPPPGGVFVCKKEA